MMNLLPFVMEMIQILDPDQISNMAAKIQKQDKEIKSQQ